MLFFWRRCRHRFRFRLEKKIIDQSLIFLEVQSYSIIKNFKFQIEYVI